MQLDGVQNIFFFNDVRMDSCRHSHLLIKIQPFLRTPDTAHVFVYVTSDESSRFQLETRLKHRLVGRRHAHTSPPPSSFFNPLLCGQRRSYKNHEEKFEDTSEDPSSRIYYIIQIMFGTARSGRGSTQTQLMLLSC